MHAYLPLVLEYKKYIVLVGNILADMKTVGMASVVHVRQHLRVLLSFTV